MFRSLKNHWAAAYNFQDFHTPTLTVKHVVLFNDFFLSHTPSLSLGWLNLAPSLVAVWYATRLSKDKSHGNCGFCVWSGGKKATRARTTTRKYGTFLIFLFFSCNPCGHHVERWQNEMCWGFCFFFLPKTKPTGLLKGSQPHNRKTKISRCQSHLVMQQGLRDNNTPLRALARLNAPHQQAGSSRRLMHCLWKAAESFPAVVEKRRDPPLRGR